MTHDEKKASEAAFRGLPFNPTWSQAAKGVYEGILKALDEHGLSPIEADEAAVEFPRTDHQKIISESVQEVSTISHSSDESSESQEMTLSTHIRSRREAIDAGFLLDVTDAAQSLGLDFSVGMTKPLWEYGIALSDDLADEELNSRLRDMLMAVRLRLASLKTPLPFVEVPVLLAFPSEPTPQIFPIYALFHKDPIDADCLLLMHPGEVKFANQSYQQN